MFVLGEVLAPDGVEPGRSSDGPFGGCAAGVQAPSARWVRGLPHERYRRLTDEGMGAMGEVAGPSSDVEVIARGVASAAAPEGGLEPAQASLLGAVIESLFGQAVDVAGLDSIAAEDLAAALADRDEAFRRRLVHHMVLAELILRPIPPEVARRVARYAEALGVEDRFVRVARRYAQGAFDLAWLDLHRSGFAEHWEAARMDQLKTDARLPDPLAAGVVDQELAGRWASFEHLESGTLGRSVWEMYTGRGFGLPGTEGGASAYLAQHDFVHVLADYGTNLFGELEVFSLIGDADPDPKGFAWIATLVGLFETGYVADAGFFTSDVKQRHLDSPGMHHRMADAMARGRAVCDVLGTDLLELDYHERADRPVAVVRRELGIPDKSAAARRAGSPGAFEVQGLSRIQQRYAASLGRGA